MSTEIRELSEIDALEELSQLFAAIWGTPEEPPINADVLKALAVSGNYVSGAFAEDRLVGGLVGWLGRTPPQGLHMHSHILGVIPGSERRGLGFDLKQHQRRWCLARGVKAMEWTTDPLVRRNVYFNVSKLGAEATEYLVNFYGQMRDGINAGDESDRLLIRWRLDSDRARTAATGNLGEVDAETLRRWSSGTILSVGGDGAPVAAESSARVLLCQVPEDVVQLRRTEPALARRWRTALRSALTGSFAKGYAVTGATRAGWYVLEST